MVKFNKKGIKLIRNKISSNELKSVVRLTENSFIRERKMRFKKLTYKIYIK